MIKKILFFAMMICNLLYINTAMATPNTDNTITNVVVVDDPFERFNRSMFSFNEFLDRILLKPIATIYKSIVPKPIKMGVSNFFDNISMLPTIANDLLQAEFHQGLNDAWRFTVNSTVGIYGLIDVASLMKLKKNKQDFGLTLAKWGYKDSVYIVLPLFGPSTLRDAIGMPIDYSAFSVYPHINPKRDRYIVYGMSMIDQRVRLLQYQNVYETAALDKYTFVRDAYLQNRTYLTEAQNKHDAH